METMTQKMVESVGASIQAQAMRLLQESEGRIPPLTQRQAFAGYGRRNVESWVKSGKLTPTRKGKVGLLYRHSDLERCRETDSLIIKYNRENGIDEN